MRRPGPLRLAVLGRCPELPAAVENALDGPDSTHHREPRTSASFFCVGSLAVSFRVVEKSCALCTNHLKALFK